MTIKGLKRLVPVTFSLGSYCSNGSCHQQNNCNCVSWKKARKLKSYRFSGVAACRAGSRRQPARTVKCSLAEYVWSFAEWPRRAERNNPSTRLGQTRLQTTATRPAKIRAGLVGSERVRRHPHRRARSGPQSGVSRGPRAYWVRVPIGSTVLAIPPRPARPTPSRRWFETRTGTPDASALDTEPRARSRGACRRSHGAR